MNAVVGNGGGILIDADIIAGIQNGSLVPGGSLSQVRSCSYDLTVGTMFWENKIHAGPEAQVTVPPGGVIALLTAEELSLPANMCATAFAINEMSSQGFLVLNPGHVDPGFKGPLTVKALNIRKVAMPLHFGDPIFTVIFQELPQSVTKAYGNSVSNRKERERRFNTTTIQTSPRTLYDREMIPSDKSAPYPGREEVNRMIWRHWLSFLTFGASLLTLLLAGIAAYKAIYPSAPAAQLGAESAVRNAVGRVSDINSQPRLSSNQTLEPIGVAAQARNPANEVRTSNSSSTQSLEAKK